MAEAASIPMYPMLIRIVQGNSSSGCHSKSQFQCSGEASVPLILLEQTISVRRVSLNENNYERFNLRSKLDFKANDWLTMGGM